MRTLSVYSADHVLLQSFDRGSQAWIVTGTKRGVLSWWKPPLMES